VSAAHGVIRGARMFKGGVHMLTRVCPSGVGGTSEIKRLQRDKLRMGCAACWLALESDQS
jgi:hypothetical protein